MLDKDESEELYMTVEIITNLEVIFQKSALSVYPIREMRAFILEVRTN